jgi:NAD-dependent deacetylase
MQKLVVLTGSGISAESGLKTFRETGGLWEDHDVMQVASYDGWLRDRDLVLGFYNERRKQLRKALPNSAHTGLAKLEKYYDVHIITQNVDDLHERAGSTKVLHLHGQLTKARSTGNEMLVYDIGYKEINNGDTCEEGHQLRPHIVWFGEPVPAMPAAAALVENADIFVVIGTSLVVYPAAGLIDYARKDIPIYLIDPNKPGIGIHRHYEFIQEKAGSGIQKLIKLLTSEK